MLGRRSVQEPCQKEFGELFAIHKPLISPDVSESEDDPVELQYDLPPELPCHVPTPQTINQEGGLGAFLKRELSSDSLDTTPSSRERRRQKLLQTAPTTATDESVYACGKLQILITTPVSTKWGPDIWNSLKTSRKGFFSSKRAADGEGSVSTPKQGRRKKTRGNKRPQSPVSPIGKSNDENCPPTSPKTNAKLVLSEETVETMLVAPTVSSNNKSRTSSFTSNKRRRASLLQRKWMQENALNLHSSCQEDCDDEDRVLSRRSRFMRAKTPTL